MADPDKFDFDPLLDEDLNSDDDFFKFDDEPGKKQEPVNPEKFEEDLIPDEKITEPEFLTQKRSSADFSPDMDALLLTAQSPMIIEAMKLISLHDFKSKNFNIFAEAIKGIDLYIKILERNPVNFKKLISSLASDEDCIDVQKISYNLYKNLTGEIPETDSQKLKAFELINEKLKIAYNKSLISSSIVSIKKYYLLSGSLNTEKVKEEIENNPAELKNKISCYIRHINIARQMIKAGNAELLKGMRGREMNVFIVKATMLLIHYFGLTGEIEQQSFYRRLHENFTKYFIER